MPAITRTTTNLSRIADIVNQRGDPINERVLFQGDIDDSDIPEILFGILDFLNLDALRTNATKHGNTEIQIQRREL